MFLLPIILSLVILLSPWTYQVLTNTKLEGDHAIWQQDAEEVFLINQRRSYYPNGWGQVFQNKLIFSWQKLEQNFFQNLDINLYFFASHPRERRDFNESEKFPAVFLPFFLLGLYFIFKQKPKLLLIYGLVLVLSSLLGSRTQGPILLYPFMVLTIVWGMLGAIKWLKH
ncbi:hypothetical protein HY386_01730 [Candidatus Daviesbacteria bacterium]|nr:hypothetical protein [Candidatus Daviesbacteria bacterium]